MINKVILIGNLGRDPEMRRLDSGVAVTKFSIATNESYMDKSGQWQTQTEWHDIVLWRHHAERAERTLKKGSTVYIEGKLTHRRYQDSEGVERFVTEVVGQAFRLLDKREGSGMIRPTSFPSENNAPPTRPESRPGDGMPSSTPVSATPTTESPSVPDVDDDLPF